MQYYSKIPNQTQSILGVLEDQFQLRRNILRHNWGHFLITNQQLKKREFPIRNYYEIMINTQIARLLVGLLGKKTVGLAGKESAGLAVRLW